MNKNQIIPVCGHGSHKVAEITSDQIKEALSSGAGKMKDGISSLYDSAKGGLSTAADKASAAWLSNKYLPDIVQRNGKNIALGLGGAALGGALYGGTASRRAYESEGEFRSRRFRGMIQTAAVTGALGAFAKPAMKFLQTGATDVAEGVNKKLLDEEIAAQGDMPTPIADGIEGFKEGVEGGVRDMKEGGQELIDTAKEEGAAYSDAALDRIKQDLPQNATLTGIGSGAAFGAAGGRAWGRDASTRLGLMGNPDLQGEVTKLQAKLHELRGANPELKKPSMMSKLKGTFAKKPDASTTAKPKVTAADNPMLGNAGKPAKSGKGLGKAAKEEAKLLGQIDHNRAGIRGQRGKRMFSTGWRTAAGGGAGAIAGGFAGDFLGQAIADKIQASN